MSQCIWLLAVMVFVLGHFGISIAQEQAKPKKLNPYNGNHEAIKEGRKLYSYYSCDGCHGRMGGGGMAGPILGYEWTFGSDDETLFKLIKGQIPDQSMPTRFGEELTDEEVWKILAFIRTLYKGDPGLINW